MVIVFDLDDTLYNEIDFVKSGFEEVANFLGDKNYFDFMMNEFQKNGSGKIFDKLIEKYDLNVSKNKLIEIYRFHTPKISLSNETKEILGYYKRKYPIALITDGHYISQKNKFFALGLEKYIDFPIFTDFYHTKKPEKKAFEMVMKKYKNKNYVYISDNPKKDFFAPIELGWQTIRYKNPLGIYKDYENNADIEINDLKEILKVIK
ncbi:HAD family hydrolase [Caminibacter pacificus]|uniref:HAD family hydrolase n=1 Tax=Caminibacter pacificus TaxID=1424653 RepID=A0AAJ4RBV3_9BACT|nr:HAD family hydrolase [Caminibacter pacificus]QCI29017.1 HAD family hydrolase [Caminibacter pacificus]ROR39172.1 putative hydrolase of the HAD superfamily [Caminibacter pacificus]